MKQLYLQCREKSEKLQSCRTPFDLEYRRKELLVSIRNFLAVAKRDPESSVEISSFISFKKILEDPQQFAQSMNSPSNFPVLSSPIFSGVQNKMEEMESGWKNLQVFFSENSKKSEKNPAISQIEEAVKKGQDPVEFCLKENLFSMAVELVGKKIIIKINIFLLVAPCECRMEKRSK